MHVIMAIVDIKHHHYNPIMDIYIIITFIHLCIFSINIIFDIGPMADMVSINYRMEYEL